MNFSDYWQFVYVNTHLTRPESLEVCVECWNKGLNKYEALDIAKISESKRGEN